MVRSIKSRSGMKPTTPGGSALDHPLPSSSTVTWRAWLAAILLIVIPIFVAYISALPGPFIFDDVGSIVENETIRTLWPISIPLWAPQDAPTAGRPVVNLSLAVNYAIDGLRPWGYRLVNVGMHAVNGLLVLGIAYRTLRKFDEPRLREHAWIFSLTLAMLWSLHPIQTESVTYVTQRTELSMAMFLLTTLYAWISAVEANTRRQRILWSLLSIVACGLGMASKEVMVVAPILVLIYDVIFFESRPVKALRKRWPFYLGLAATWLVLAGLMSTNPRGISVGFNLAIRPVDYLTTQFWAIVHYLALACWPAELCGDYGIFIVTQPSIWIPRLLLLLVLAGATVWAAYRRSALEFLGAWFFIILAPTSSIVPIVSEPIAERRMYLPLVAVIAIFLWLFFEATTRIEKRVKNRTVTSAIRNGAVLLVLVIGTIYALATHARNRVYASDIAFWTDVVQKRPDNSRGFTNLGLAHSELNEDELAKGYFLRAIELAPTNFDAHFNLGVWYADRNKLEEAIVHYQQAVELQPSMEKAHCNLGNSYAQLGKLDEALLHFNRALDLKPSMSRAWYSRGLLYARMQRTDESISDLRAAIEGEPDMALAHFQLGNVLMSAKRTKEAIEQFRKANQLDPNFAGSRLNLGAALIRSEDLLGAIEAIQEAIAIEPANSDAYSNLAFCFVGLDRIDEAIAAYTRCVELQPGDAQAWYRLGKLHARQQDVNEARRCFERVLLLDPRSIEATRQLQYLGQP